MIKCMALMRRKQGMAQDKFVDYYENHHAKLILELTPEIVLYERNYVNTGGSAIFNSVDLDFDVLTMIGYDDHEAYQAALDRHRKPAIAQRIAEDEEKLFNRDYTRFFIVETRSGS